MLRIYSVSCSSSLCNAVMNNRIHVSFPVFLFISLWIRSLKQIVSSSIWNDLQCSKGVDVASIDSWTRLRCFPQTLLFFPWFCFSLQLQYHAGLASGLLNQQSLKRSANQMGVSAKRRPKAQPTTLVLPPQWVAALNKAFCPGQLGFVLVFG